MRRREHGQAIALALAFGLVPRKYMLIGWAIGSLSAGAITAIDHWIAFGLLGALGAKMLWDARSEDPVEEADAAARPHGPWLTVREVLLLSRYASIDAPAAGIKVWACSCDSTSVAVALIAGSRPSCPSPASSSGTASARASKGPPRWPGDRHPDRHRHQDPAAWPRPA